MIDSWEVFEDKGKVEQSLNLACMKIAVKSINKSIHDAVISGWQMIEGNRDSVDLVCLEISGPSG